MIYKKLGLDLGRKTLGIAISDGLNLTAQSRENFHYLNEDLDCCINKVKEYINKEKIDKIILGYPTYYSGDKSSTTLYVDKFYLLLKKNFTQEIILINETMTTKIANEYMIEANLSRKKRCKKKDALAAQIILQNYLNRLK